jgi:acyl carrier protein
MGRIDRQIKLRGYRIELDEIESQLRACDGVAHAIVVVSRLGVAASSDALVAYYVGDEERSETKLDDDVVRAHCERVMPKYMVPSVFMRLDKLPLNANDKVDYKALPKPIVNDDAASRRHASSGGGSGAAAAAGLSYRSMSPTQRAVADVWAAALGIDAIELRTGADFFAVGGDSLSAMRAMALLSERVGRDLPLSSLFQHTTVATLATFIGDVVALRAMGGVARAPVARVDRAASSFAVSFAQERFWFLDQLFPQSSDVNRLY